MAYFEVPCVLDSNKDIDYVNTEKKMHKAIELADEQISYMN